MIKSKINPVSMFFPTSQFSPISRIPSLFPISSIFFLSKQILLGQTARNSLLKGVNILTDAVQSTLGPKGKNVVIDRKYDEVPKITKDGVTVAKAVALENSVENLGVKMMRQSAKIAAEKVGDGTTTATVLGREIFREGCRSLNTGLNQIELCKGIAKALEIIKEYLDKNTIKITNKKDIAKVATISANNDEKIGGLIAEIFEKIGTDGAINVQSGNKLTHEVQFTKGMQFRSGYISSYFANDEKTQKCVFNDPLIYVTSKKIENIEGILKIFEFALKSQRPLLIVCEDIESELLATAIINKLKGILKICIIKSPFFGEKKNNLLNDLALLTNSVVIDNELNDLKNSGLEKVFGQAKKVIVSKDSTMIIGGKGEKNVGEKIKDLKQFLKEIEGKPGKENESKEINERIRRLNGSVALFKVGGIHEMEINEIKDRIDDAICATKSAIKGGILPGGGTALLYASKELDKVKVSNNFEREHGIKIVKNALRKPFKIICENAGLNGDVLINELLKENNTNMGINALTGKKADLIKSGIIDPTDVVKTSIESAIKVAIMMLRTETVITELKNKKNKSLL